MYNSKKKPILTNLEIENLYTELIDLRIKNNYLVNKNLLLLKKINKINNIVSSFKSKINSIL